MVVRKMPGKTGGKQRGSALTTALVFVTVCGIMIGSALVASNNQTRNTYRSRIFNSSLAAATVSVESMSQQAYYIATTRPAQLKGNFGNLNNAILGIHAKEVDGHIPVKVGNKAMNGLVATADNNGSYSVINDPTDDWNGFNIQRWKYKMISFMNEGDEDTGELDANSKRLGFQGAGMEADLEINFIPLYQYAIFYDQDLEIHNGPVMDIKGPVHSNRTLWVATQSGTNFHDRVSAAGKFRSYNDFSRVVTDASNKVAKINKDGVVIEASPNHKGDVQIKKPNGSFVKVNNGISSTMDTNGNTVLDSGDGNWLVDALARYEGRLKDSAMGVKPIKPPLPFVEKPDGTRGQADAGELIQRIQPGDSQSMKQEKMESKADIIIEGNPSQSTLVNGEYTNITIKTKTGTVLPNTVTVGGKTTRLVTPGKFYDNREQKDVYTLDLNMAVAKERSASLGITSGNGLIYASPTGAGLPSVRVTNGASMPSNYKDAMTIATDKPMYLAGNINSVNKKTVLLAADAITVLSQGQTDNNLVKDSIPKSKGETITNAIFMLGQVSSKYDNGADSYADGLRRVSMSGGAHNVLRYLENWSGVPHEFNGSLICLFESRIATSSFWRNKAGTTTKLNFYDAPTRRYNWDASLMTKEPPAGMPVLVQVVTGKLNRISHDEAKQRLNL